MITQHAVIEREVLPGTTALSDRDRRIAVSDHYGDGIHASALLQLTDIVVDPAEIEERLQFVVRVLPRFHQPIDAFSSSDAR